VMCISPMNRTDSRRGKHYFLPIPLILMPMGLNPVPLRFVGVSQAVFGWRQPS
jgi:hypothetical protein